ncbi:MAG: caspase family protein [Planctomycetota bacterium]|nr:caspase family protein [Planctomycetota bacterium]
MRVVSRWILVPVVLAALVGSATAQDPAKPKLHVQRGHAADITAVAISRNGTHLLTGGMDRTLRIWETDTGREVRVMRIGPNPGRVLAARFGPDDKHVLAGCFDGIVRVFETATGTEDRARALQGHEGAVASLVLTSDGRRVVTASYDGTARIFETVSGKLLATLAPASGAARPRLLAVDVRADGAVVATGAWDGAVTLWNVATGQAAFSLRRPSGKAAVSALVYERDQRHVLAAYNDGAILRWNTETRQVVQRYAGHTGNVGALALRIDGRYVLSGSADGTARLFEVATGTQIGKPKAHDGGVSAVAFARNGIVAATAAGRVGQLWNMQTARVAQRFAATAEQVLDIELSRDGRFLAVGTTGGEVHLWSLVQGRVVRRFKGHTSDVGSLAFSSDGKQLLTASEDTTVRLWETGARKAPLEVTRHTGGTHAVAVSGDGASFASGGCDNEVRVWSSASPDRPIARLVGHTQNVEAVALSPDGKQVLTGSIDTTVRLWSVETQKELWRYDGFGNHVTSVAFSPTDPSRVAAATQGGEARILDRLSGKPVQDVEGRESPVWSLAFSPDGKHLLTGTQDGEARLWAVGSTGLDPVRVYRGHSRRVKSVAFSPDGRFAFTGSYDQTIRVYDVSNPDAVAMFMAYAHSGFVVVDPQERFDASDAGAASGMHWVVPSDAVPGLESVALDQIKVRYYEPGLLPKVLGFNPQPRRAVDALAPGELAPRVSLKDEDGRLEVRLANRGAGIGKVVVQINGKEVIADARPRGSNPDAKELTIPIDLRKDARFAPGEDNDIRVFAYDKSDDIRSRGGRARRRAAGTKADPSLWAVVAGVSDYTGEDADLLFAAKDARDIHKALSVAGAARFTEARTHVTLVENPSRAALLEALRAARQAKPADTFVLYLAGHGATYKDDFHFLTSEADASEVADDAMRDRATVSSADLTDEINAIPARRLVLILDTCASGRFIEDLIGQRGVPSDQRRPLDRLKDRTGMHVIAGCAADRLSFENPRYGQGLLTYSLLLGMKGERLGEDGFVDVARLFGFAEGRVPALAEEIGREQVPVVARPLGGISFEVGQVKGDVKAQIPLRMPKPYITRSVFIDPEQTGDVQGLAEKVDQALREASTPDKNAAFVFWNVDPMDDACRIQGTYRLVDGGIEATFKLWRGRDKPISEKFVVTASLERLPGEILKRALEHLPAAER